MKTTISLNKVEIAKIIREYFEEDNAVVYFKVIDVSDSYDRHQGYDLDSIEVTFDTKTK